MVFVGKAHSKRENTMETTDKLPGSVAAEGPLLGRGSQVRRVKSAHKRASSANVSSDRQRLFKQSYYNGDSSSSTCSSDWGRSTPVQFQQQTTSPPPSYNVAIHKKSVQGNARNRPRPKTARVNRVAPSTEMPTRRGASATTGGSELTKKPESPPDPLEPWSTRGIANMNTLLAWDESDHDSI